MQVESDSWQQDCSPESRLHLLGCLPVGLLHELAHKLGFQVRRG